MNEKEYWAMMKREYGFDIEKWESRPPVPFVIALLSLVIMLIPGVCCTMLSAMLDEDREVFRPPSWRGIRYRHDGPTWLEIREWCHTTSTY